MEEAELNVDLLVDYSSIEITLNNTIALSFPIKPVFIYDKVELSVDGNTYDARGILYTLKKSKAIDPNI